MTLTFGCVVLLAAPVQLGGDALKSLRKDAERMRAAAVGKDAKVLADTMYPGAVKLIGGPKATRELIAQSIAEQDKGPLKLERADIADPHFCAKASNGATQCVLRQTNHYSHEADRFFTVADVIAVSAKDGAAWTFLSASEHTLAELRKSFPELSPELPIEPQKPPAPEPR